MVKGFLTLGGGGGIFLQIDNESLSDKKSFLKFFLGGGGGGEGECSVRA